MFDVLNNSSPMSETIDSMSTKNADIVERIETIITSKYRSVNSFAKAVGVSHSYINNMKQKGVANPSYEVLMSIINETGVNAEWLLTGQGEPWSKPEPMDTEEGERLRKNIIKYGAQLKASGNAGNQSKTLLGVLRDQIASSRDQMDSTLRVVDELLRQLDESGPS